MARRRQVQVETGAVIESQEGFKFLAHGLEKGTSFHQPGSGKACLQLKSASLLQKRNQIDHVLLAHDL